MSPMNILITNDDGIHAKGLTALVAALSGFASVTVLAPDRQRSTVSHSLTLHKPLRLKERTGLFGQDVHAYELNGMPADCVKVGIRELLEQSPDLVISGINEGPNLGTDVVYSGTVSAARESVLEGVPALAVSLTSKDHDVDYSFGAMFIKDLVPVLKKTCWSSSLFLNINIPKTFKPFSMDDMQVTRLGERKYDELLEKRHDPAGHEYFWMMGTIVDEHKNPVDTDVHCVLNGKVSITPLHWDFTDQTSLARLQNVLIPHEVRS